MKIVPVEFCMKGITLREALKQGLIDKLVKSLEEAGIEVRFVALILDPVSEPGFIRIGHQSSEEIERGLLRISLSPNMSERTINIIKNVLERLYTEQGEKVS